MKYRWKGHYLLKDFPLRESRKLRHRSHDFFPQKSYVILHQTSDFLVLTRKTFIGVTAPKIRLNKTSEAIWHEFFNYRLIFAPWPSWSNSIWGSCVWFRPAAHTGAKLEDNVLTWLVQERRTDCSSLDFKGFESQRIMSWQISVFYMKLGWPRRLHTWLTFQDKFSKRYY